MKKLAEELNIEAPNYVYERENCESALQKVSKLLGNTPIAIDYSATPRPVGLARLLSEHGMRVERIYLDSFNGEERKYFLMAQRALSSYRYICYCECKDEIS